MALVIVELKGGPDNGVELGYNVPPPLPAHIDYAGSVYDHTPGTHNPVVYSYNETKSLGGLKATKLMSGWASLRRTLNQRMASSVNQARRDSEAALRAVSRGHTVRR